MCQTNALAASVAFLNATSNATDINDFAIN